MKLILALALILGNPLASAAGPLYLDTQNFPSEAQSKLLAAATGERPATGPELFAWMDAYESAPTFEKIIEAYEGGLYRKLEIDPKQGERWKKKYPVLFKGIDNYVGSSDESMDDSGPSWMKINASLRAKEKLGAADAKFLKEILSSLERLPTAAGLVFRGQPMRAERFAAIPAKGLWPQPAFTSTTLSPEKARLFGSGQEGWSKRGVIILKTKGGAPVSPLTFDTGEQSGQPGRLYEREVLLTPGAKLYVHAKFFDASLDTYFVLAEER